MGRFLLFNHGYGYGLVVQINHRLLDQLMFILEHIWRLMATSFRVRRKLGQGSRSMDQFQQFDRGCEYGLVELISRKLLDQLM
jgi:hypothetical protein